MITVTDENWQARANCRATDPDTMQPEYATPEEVETAKAVCVGCPVRGECRELARSQPGGAYGVHDGEWWGPPPRELTKVCEWCGALVDDTERSTRRFCKDSCRKSYSRAKAFRARVA